MTDDERTQFDAAMAQVKALNGDIERAEALLDEERTAPAVRQAARKALLSERLAWRQLILASKACGDVGYGFVTASE